MEFNSKIRVEDEIILCCARTSLDLETKDKLLSLIENEINWTYLLEKTSKNRLLPLLYFQINSVCPQKVPKDVLNNLKDDFDENLHKNLLLTGELIKILNLFQSKEISAVPYKGPVLAVSAYGNLGLRVFDDLDIFIQETDIGKVKELLNSKGYEMDSSNVGDLNYIKSQREYHFINSDSGVQIEIKWKLSGISFSFKTDIRYLYDPKSFEHVKISNTDILSFSREDLLLILCIHNAGHRFQYLQWICDVAELICSNNMNWDKIMDKAGKLGIKRMLFINLLLANDLLDVKIPRDILEEINKDKHSKSISNKLKDDFFSKNNGEPGLLEYSIFHIKIRENLRNGLMDFILHVFAPSDEDLAEIRLPGYLFPLYYIVRPILLLKRQSWGIFKSKPL
ncbi:MAG: nucleotidyltransferase family protein [Methanobacterium sp.]|uniref:nucleotidyltransferase domain-containing protein n=1 Tax=Methanobacterium sp. TaxID=2164 RepID=UPI003D653B9E|nr:nucleotidyltransferase family protein [Methanobacterium sp.]